MKIFLFSIIFLLIQFNILEGNELVDSLKKQVTSISNQMPANYQLLVTNIYGQATADSAYFDSSKFNDYMKKFNFSTDIIKKFESIVYVYSTAFQTFNSTIKNLQYQHEEFIGIARNNNGFISLAFVKGDATGEYPRDKMRSALKKQCDSWAGDVRRDCWNKVDQSFWTYYDCQKLIQYQTQYNDCMNIVKKNLLTGADCQRIGETQRDSPCQQQLVWNWQVQSEKSKISLTKTDIQTIDSALRRQSLSYALAKLNTLSNSNTNENNSEFQNTILPIHLCETCSSEIKNICAIHECLNIEKKLENQQICLQKQEKCYQYLKNADIGNQCKQCVNYFRIKLIWNWN